MSNSDAPVTAAELARWDAAVRTLEECDDRARIKDKGTAGARKAVEAARNGRRS